MKDKKGIVWQIVQLEMYLMLVVSNQTHAAHSFDFKITRMISDLIYMKKLLDSVCDQQDVGVLRRI